MARTDSPAARRRALHLYVCLMRASASVTRRTHTHLAGDSLTVSQFAVLEALLHLGPLSQRELGAKILRSENNLTTVIDNLSKRQLVERQPDPTDRRINQVHLTNAGKGLIRKVFARHARCVTREVSGLSATEQDQLAGLLKKLGRWEETR